MIEQDQPVNSDDRSRQEVEEEASVIEQPKVETSIRVPTNIRSAFIGSEEWMRQQAWAWNHMRTGIVD